MKKILIDARLLDGQAGGIQQVVCGIAQGLSNLDTSRLEIGFCVYQGESEWLNPYLAKHFSVIEIIKPTVELSHTGHIGKGKNFIRKSVGHLLGGRSIRLSPEPESASKFEPDLVHFIHQNIFSTECPFLFTPHDLQHEYYPEYFDKRTLMVRRNLYKRHALRSEAVVCISESCQRDAVRYLGVEKEKCPVIYNAPLNGSVSVEKDASRRVSQKYNLPERFLFYPAKSYPHKNHKRLLEALHFLKSEGVRVPLVCSGPLTGYYQDILQPILVRFGLERQVRFLGWLDDSEVSALYDLATALIFPSEFEGFGLPLIEAMRAGLPVCCSNTSCVPEIVQDAAVTFDPRDLSQMAAAIEQVWTKESLRQSLIKRGELRAADFSWEKSAQQYLDLYASLLLKSA